MSEEIWELLKQQMPLSVLCHSLIGNEANCFSVCVFVVSIFFEASGYVIAGLGMIEKKRQPRIRDSYNMGWVEQLPADRQADMQTGR